MAAPLTDFHSQKVTISDRFFAVTLLRLFPRSVMPNHLTIFRFFSIPFVAAFLLFGDYKTGIVLFAVSALTDALDGAMARTRDQITDWGKLNDPLADKLLISVAAIILIPKYLNSWIAFVIIFIEMILIGTAYYSKNHGGKVIQANLWGKLKMFSQSIGIGLLIIYAFFSLPGLLFYAQIIFYAAIILAFVSVITYSI